MNHISIRWKVTFWNTLAFAIIVIGFSVMVYSLLRQTHYQQIDEKLSARLDELLSDPVVEQRPAQRLNFWFHKLGKHVEISGIAFNQSSQVVASGEGLDSTSPVEIALASNERRFATVELGDHDRYRRLVTKSQLGQEVLEIQLFAELEHLDEELVLVLKSLVLTVAVTLVVAALVSYLLAKKSLGPVQTLTQMTDAITAENLDMRLPVPNPRDELGQLATTVNSMIGRLQSSFEQVKRFTADASHELRTPIAVIRSEAELGTDQASEPGAIQRFHSILEESTRLAMITSQLLELSRNDSAVGAGFTETIDVSQIIAETVDSMQSMASDRGQRLVIDSIANDATTVGDEGQLRRVFQNLIENAIKYSRHGALTHVRCQAEGDFVVLEVIDSGIGIPQESVPRIFDRFYRVTKENSSVESGAGLGLSIVKSIVDRHCGRVEVESEFGSGSAFRVFLPTSD